ncbi:la-related protein 6-like [Leuresthes tenuis]|uniref:la-related protein 6-like n=1 Tax=Leuresthes tenuis TaxID=355514 RepID=UPI003B5114EA
MSNLNGNGAQSTQDEEDREGELLCLKIKTLLDEMFSNRHLAEDGFLLKHVQKNKKGYVSLKLLTCLKKIKALTTNWYMTLAAAECSDLLEVNDECTKVRRKEPLPKWLLCSPTSRLLLVWNASEEQRVEDGAVQGPECPSLLLRVLQNLGTSSSFTSVTVLQPGEEIPKELQCYAKRHKELGQHLCAVVKFDSLEAVRRAYNALRAEKENSNAKGLCVVPLGCQSMHNVPKCEPSEEKNMDQSVEDTLSGENPLVFSEVQQEPPSTVRSSKETPDTSQPQVHLDSSTHGVFDDVFTSSSDQSFCGLNQRYSRISLCSGDYNKECSQSPWVLRRKSAAIAVNPKMATHLNAPCIIQRVLRQPFGPDGTKGFHARQKRSNSFGWSSIGKFMKQGFA